MAPTPFDYLKAYILPLPLLGGSLFYFILTFLTNPTLPFTDFATYKEKTFAGMWFRFGPMLAQDTPPVLPALLAHSQGLILDIGPGSGDQVHRFSHPETITAVYGIEPGISLHEKLKVAADKAGLGPKYHILGCTADWDSIVPALLKDGLIKPNQTSAEELQLFDEIACVRVLCGVPDQMSTLTDLYNLLKPGGRFVLCEHVLNTKSTSARLTQKVYMALGWKHLMGGCELTRNTMETFSKVAEQKDGGWAKVEVEEVDDFSPLMHIVGVLTKKK